MQLSQLRLVQAGLSYPASRQRRQRRRNRRPIRLQPGRQLQLLPQRATASSTRKPGGRVAISRICPSGSRK